MIPIPVLILRLRRNRQNGQKDSRSRGFIHMKHHRL